MVGVPRSKGCRNCVQRRIKCDQTRPVCQRCQKRGLDCPGYEPAVKFQDEGPKLKHHFDKKQNVEDLKASSDSVAFNNTPSTFSFALPSPSLPSSISSTFSSSSSSPVSSSSSNFVDWAVVSSYSSPPTSPDEVIFEDNETTPYNVIIKSLVSPATFQAQLFGLFIASMGATGATAPLVPSHQANWLKYLADTPSQNVPEALNSSIQALTLTHIGRTQGKPALVESSRYYYGLALKQLARTFRNSPNDDALSSSTLSTTMLLSFYEMFDSTNNNGWVRHAGGAAALIRARGPVLSTATDIDRVMFMAYRNALVIHAFEAGTACFLTEPAWLETSRRLHRELSDDSEFSRILEDYFEEMAQLPGVTKDARDFPALSREFLEDDERLQARNRLKDRVAGHRQNLKKLYARMTLELNKRSLGLTTKAAKNLGEHLFPNQYFYQNIGIASIHCGHWTCLTILNVTLVELIRAEKVYAALKTGAFRPGMTFGQNSNYSQAPDFSAAPGTHPPPQPFNTFYSQAETPLFSSAFHENPADAYIPSPALLRAESIRNSTNCCRSVDYMGASVFHGPFFLTFGLRVCLLAFPGERERQWVRQKLKELGRKFGMAADLEEEIEMRRAFEWTQEDTPEPEDDVLPDATREIRRSRRTELTTDAVVVLQMTWPQGQKQEFS